MIQERCKKKKKIPWILKRMIERLTRVEIDQSFSSNVDRKRGNRENSIQCRCIRINVFRYSWYHRSIPLVKPTTEPFDTPPKAINIRLILYLFDTLPFISKSRPDIDICTHASFNSKYRIPHFPKYPLPSL